MQKGVIDRLEGKYAVIEMDGMTRDFELSCLPEGAQPGDVVMIEGDRITVDPVETAKRKQEIDQLMAEVWED